MVKVVGIGAAVSDVLMATDAFPKEDTKLQAHQRTDTLRRGCFLCGIRSRSFFP